MNTTGSQRQHAEPQALEGDPAVSVAVIGLGSRGLSILERLLTLAAQSPQALGPLRIDVIDPSCQGFGLHTDDQPDYLLLNTTCGQVSMFPDSHTVGEAAPEPGPTLFDWVTARGLKIAPDGVTVGASGRAIEPWDFLPRRVLGEYLAWFRGHLESTAPAGVSLSMHATSVVDIDSKADGPMHMTLATGKKLTADYAFLTLGHLLNEGPAQTPPGSHRSIRSAFPLPDQVSAILPGQSVAITGFGLTAIDVLSALTRGRGGQFVEDGERLHYVPSGEEPSIVLLSRSGVPFRARPRICRFDHHHEPLVLTRQAIDSLRTLRKGRLSFDQDVLPLLLTEMRLAYRLSQARREGGEAERDLRQRLATEGVAQTLERCDSELGAFDPMALLDGATGMPLTSSSDYQRWLLDSVSNDLREGRQEIPDSPVKAALDIFRQERDTIRYAVDFRGLTDASLETFNRRMVPLMNRAVVGPQFERHQELVALMEAGVLETPLGPASDIAWDAETESWLLTSTALDEPCQRRTDWLCAAQYPSPSVKASADPLIQALYRRGTIRPFLPESRVVTGADLSPDKRLIDAAGQPNSRLWALGPLCEGAIFYNHLVPSPEVWSRPISDAHACVEAMRKHAAAAREEVALQV